MTRLNTDMVVEDLSVIATDIAQMQDQLAWLEAWLAGQSLKHNCPGVIARHLRRSRWYVKKVALLSEKFPDLIPTDYEALCLLHVLGTAPPLWSREEEDFLPPNPEIPIEMYRLVARETGTPSEAASVIEMVEDRGLSTRQLQHLLRGARGEVSAVPYMSKVRMITRVHKDELDVSLTMRPAGGETWEPRGDPPTVLEVTAVEVNYPQEKDV